MSDISQRLKAIWHLESAAVTGYLARLLGDLDAAEDIAQDTLVTAIENWQINGVPENPGGWLMVTARNKALDHLRQGKRQRELLSASVDLAETMSADDLESTEIADDILRLMFICCHPLLSPDARGALVLRLVAGLSTEDIARAYLVPETTLAQRITRAKKTLSAARIPFEIPTQKERQYRVQSVLEAVYLLFNEGYVATGGDHWMQPVLCHQALRLGRSLAALIPDDAEVLGLAALLEFQASRLEARLDDEGQPVLLGQQNRALWDALLIRRGDAYLEKAFGMGSAVGTYCLQACISACHAHAETIEDTPWDEILALYDGLCQIQPTPVIFLNRALALAKVNGAESGLRMLDELKQAPALQNYAPFHAARGDLLQELGDHEQAEAAFLRGASLTSNQAERKLLQKRALICGSYTDSYPAGSRQSRPT